MSDFAQIGLISTLQRLNDSHLPQIEAELADLSRLRPIALVLPCHARDLYRPALDHILEELSGAHWLREVAVSLNGLDGDGLNEARKRFAVLPQKLRLIWNDPPEGEATQAGTAPAGGKGTNIFAAFQALAREGNCSVIATQDCDVASFRASDLARLCYAVANPDFGYRFAKAYYSRVTDRLYGRVSRLFFTPLLHAIVRVAGHYPITDFLLSFRYPLAGEVAMTSELAGELPHTNGWGVELVHLCEIFRRVDPQDVCQVDGGTGYDHKHQPATSSLAEMAEEIAKELFRQLAIEGLPTSGEFVAAVAQNYHHEAEHALRRSIALARMNALPIAIESEREIIATFARRLESLAG